MGSRFALAWLVATVFACGGNGAKPASDATGAACSNPATDCPAATACQMATCDATGACATSADSSQDGMSCGTNMACQGGMCLSTMAVCGDGVVEFGEQCDFGGSMNGPGTGCEMNCMFSCTMSPNSCDDGMVCNGTETCAANSVGGKAGQACMPGTPPASGTSCGTGMVCVTQICSPDVCGNGYPVAPEECDDGGLNGTTGDGCSSTCKFTCVSTDSTRDCASTNPCVLQGTCNDTTHVCTAGASVTDGTPCGTGGSCESGVCTQPICGDGIRETGEQCDDGNTTNLDGCDASCKFEQAHRINSLAVSFATTTYCTKNALGVAIVGSTAKTDLTNAINTGVGNGSITIMFDMLGLTDLSGTNAASFSVGVLGGTPATSTTTTYNGASDLDWWITTAPTTIDMSRVATTQMPASITSHALNAGPKEISVTVSFVGVIVTMDMFATKLTATLGASSQPTTSSNNQTPGHLAGEHVDPALTSFASSTAGQLCGNTTAQSLYAVAVPSALVNANCGYTTANTLLDVYISGCKAYGIISEVTATQPDVSRDGATYKFTANSSKQVVSCTRNNASDTLNDCLANAGFTSLFTFTTDRVIAR